MSTRHNTMMNPPIEERSPKVDSKFTLVTLGSMRARQINSYFNQLGGAGLGGAATRSRWPDRPSPSEEIAADKIRASSPSRRPRPGGRR